MTVLLRMISGDSEITEPLFQAALNVTDCFALHDTVLRAGAGHDFPQLDNRPEWLGEGTLLIW